jgi:OmcA/MtrC family decaheme c-type cytochrome
VKHSDPKFWPSPHWSGLAAAALLAFALAGCGGGDDGATGPAGPAGQTGATGPAGPAGKDLTAAVKVPSNTVAATDASAAAWKALAPQVTVTSVTISSPPVVKFTVKDAAGNPIVGLGNKSQTTSQTVAILPNLGFTLAKLVPEQTGTVLGKVVSTEPSKWVSYLVTRAPSVNQSKGTLANSDFCDSATAATVCGGSPTSDREGTLIDNGDGSYQYTFYRDVTKVAAQVASLLPSKDGLSKKADLGDVSYDGTLTHRLGIQIGGAAPGTGSNNPAGSSTGAPASVSMVNTANVWYDFVPAGGTPTNTRQITKIDSCSDCHAGKVLAHGSRKDPNYCVTCHTDQLKYRGVEATASGMALSGSTNVLGGRAIGNFPNMVHKIHMGEHLVMTGYNFANAKFNEVLYPQPVTNCVKCHDGSATAKVKTANGDNWKNAPSALACGSCHDGIDFATGLGVTLADKAYDLAAGNPVGTTRSGHGARQGLTDNTLCNVCHSAASIPVYHVTVDMTGSSGRAGYPVNTAQDVPTPGYPSGQGPSIPLASQLNMPAGVYKIDFEIKSASVAGAAGAKKATVVYRILKDGAPVTLNASGFLIDGVDGSPSVYVAYGVPQDGITAPADWNATKSAKVIDIRDKKSGNSQTGPDASGYYTATLGAVIPDDATMVTAGLGVEYQGFVQLNNAAYPKGIRLREPKFATKLATGYTARRAIVSADKCNNCHGQLGVSPSFHGGARNNGEGCAFCHDPNRSTGHVGAAYSFGGGWSVQVKNMVHAIHGSEKRAVAFTYEATAANPTGFQEVKYPGVLHKCEQCHVPGSYDFSTAANNAALPNLLWTTDTKGDMSNPTNAPSIGLSPWVTILGSGQTDYRTDNLVSSPLSAACFGCHDSRVAVSHMQLNGGTLVSRASTVAIGGNRANGFSRIEACTVCHGPGKDYDIKKVHAQ